MRPPLESIGYPLKMSGSLDPKPWGGSRLAWFGKQLPDERIGESLESGSDSMVTNGSLAGRSLGDIAIEYPGPLLGERGKYVSGEFSDFPLLVKLIDAHENLSVQVHPDDTLAPSGRRGKTEAWLILHADPGAQLVVGVDGPVELDRISEQIVSEVVSPGDVFFIPAGTIHAIGAGVLLYEVQQASDVTYRLYDWGRQREMHVQDGKRAANVELRAARVAPLRLDEHREILVACRHFALERWTIQGQLALRSTPETFCVLTVLDGDLSISGVSASAGNTFVLPADLPPSAVTGAGVILLAYIPDLAHDLMQPLAAAGHDEDSIASLGVRS